MKIMIINGPNLNMLKYRDKSIYGNVDIEKINSKIKKEYTNVTFEFNNSNCEGLLITHIHKCIIEEFDALVINPGAYSHYSYAIYDALLMFKGIKVEVHLSDVDNREEFRKKLVTAKACNDFIKGHQENSYYLAVEKILRGDYV